MVTSTSPNGQPQRRPGLGHIAVWNIGQGKFVTALHTDTDPGYASLMLLNLVDQNKQDLTFAWLLAWLADRATQSCLPHWRGQQSNEASSLQVSTAHSSTHNMTFLSFESV